MKFGISASEMGEGGSPEGVAKTAEMAEEHGYDLVTLGDTQAILREAYTTLSLAGSRTEEINLGPFVTNPITRHPVVTASAICTLNELTDGRAMLGIATGDSGVLTLGKRPARLAKMKETITMIQKLARGEEVDLGETDIDSGPVEIRWITEENQPRRVPVMLAAEGPKTQKLAGKVADGAWLGGGLTPDLLEKQVENVKEGAKEAGRDLSDIELWVSSRANVDDERDEAVEALKSNIAGMANHSLRFTLEDKGIPDEYRDRILELKDKYDPHLHQATGKSENVKLLERLELTEFIADRYAIVGEPSDCAAKIRDIEQVDGIDGIYISTPTNRTKTVLKRMAEEVFPNV
jgi:5,10-methylenetetrahydromethanopterin reductase